MTASLNLPRLVATMKAFRVSRFLDAISCIFLSSTGCPQVFYCFLVPYEAVSRLFSPGLRYTADDEDLRDLGAF